MERDLTYCFQCEFFEQCQDATVETLACGDFVTAGTLIESGVNDDE